jgi:hypothetical protein
MESRAFTVEEVREEMLNYLKAIANYWADLPDKTNREKCDGLVFSFLTLLDGCAMFPALDVALAPHESDKAYHQNEGMNWYESGMIINDCMLHELYVKK